MTASLPPKQNTLFFWLKPIIGATLIWHLSLQESSELMLTTEMDIGIHQLNKWNDIICDVLFSEDFGCFENIIETVNFT